MHVCAHHIVMRGLAWCMCLVRGARAGSRLGISCRGGFSCAPGAGRLSPIACDARTGLVVVWLSGKVCWLRLFQVHRPGLSAAAVGRSPHLTRCAVSPWHGSPFASDCVHAHVFGD
jgi:hypothetical protein